MNFSLTGVIIGLQRLNRVFAQSRQKWCVRRNSGGEDLDVCGREVREGRHVEREGLNGDRVEEPGLVEGRAGGTTTG